MPPYQMAALNGSLIDYPSPAQSPSYSSGEIVVNVIYGTGALAIGIISIWQGHRVWRLWHPVPRHGTYELEAITQGYEQEPEGNDVEGNNSSSDLHLEQPSTASQAFSDHSQTLDMDISDVDPAPTHSSEASLMSPVGLGGDMSLQQSSSSECQSRAQPSS